MQICKFNITVSTQFLQLYYSFWCPGLQRLQRFDFYFYFLLGCEVWGKKGQIQDFGSKIHWLKYSQLLISQSQSSSQTTGSQFFKTNNLTTSLINVSLKFQTLISEICQYFLLKKVKSFCIAKASLIFSIKNISVFGCKAVKHLTNWPLNELIKLKMLWTTGPWYFKINVLVFEKVWDNRSWNVKKNRKINVFVLYSLI